MKKIIMLTIVLLPILCGCGAKARPITGPYGKNAYHLNCSGIQNSMADCLEKAGELCPQGYDVLDSRQTSTPNVYVYQNQVHTLGTIETRELVVQCK